MISSRSMEQNIQGAAKYLEKDRDALLTFYDSPTEHRCHIRASRSDGINFCRNPSRMLAVGWGGSGTILRERKSGAVSRFRPYVFCFQT